MISVIIPTLNEARSLPRTLAAVRAQPVPHEILVVDAGSQDETTQVATAAGARTFTCPVPQRAMQMNLGAAHARGEVLLFLHADTLLPSGGLEQLASALRDDSTLGGAFTRRFDSHSPWLRLTCWLADWRGRWLGWHLGDQAIFARRAVFDELGGFRQLPLFEDLDFSRRLARRGGVVTLDPPVSSSARRFAARGPLRTTLSDFWLTCRYLAGADPARLAERRARTQAATDTKSLE